jgi:hypothetical protein
MIKEIRWAAYTGPIDLRTWGCQIEKCYLATPNQLAAGLPNRIILKS